MVVGCDQQVGCCRSYPEPLKIRLAPTASSAASSLTPLHFGMRLLTERARVSSRLAPTFPASFRRKPESSAALQAMVSYKSCQPGLLFSISSSFHIRFQFFKAFSRLMANSMVAWSSYHTN